MYIEGVQVQGQKTIIYVNEFCSKYNIFNQARYQLQPSPYPLVTAWWDGHDLILPHGYIGWLNATDRKRVSISANTRCYCMSGPTFLQGVKQVFYKIGGFLCQTTRCWHHQRDEGGMFYLMHPPSIGPLLLLSCFEKHLSKLICLFVGASGLNTLTSRSILSYLPPQNPLAAISNLAPSVVFAVRKDINSVVISYNSGSTLTSLHTSVSRVAIRSLI